MKWATYGSFNDGVNCLAPRPDFAANINLADVGSIELDQQNSPPAWCVVRLRWGQAYRLIGADATRFLADFAQFTQPIPAGSPGAWSMLDDDRKPLQVHSRALAGTLADRDRLADVIARAAAELARIEAKWSLIDEATSHLESVSLLRESCAVGDATYIIHRARKILAEAGPEDLDALARAWREAGPGEMEASDEA